MSPAVPLRVAVVGAGLAGTTCAHALAAAGCRVHLLDKARGPGGRLATRRLEWADARGQAHTARIDHGAPAFTAGSAPFRAFLQAAPAAAAVQPWAPALKPGSRPLSHAGPLWLAAPDMPALCRALLQDGAASGAIATSWSCTVDALVRQPEGWQITAAGRLLPGGFDVVVLAIPPAQAAPLLAPHKPTWAQRASLALMQPCWTLMGVAQPPAQPWFWQVARPDQGPLAWVIRHDAKPGREPAADTAHPAAHSAALWVAHARASWSRQHLEQPADEVQAELHAALEACLGEPVQWQHAVVHRWRYALPPATGSTPAAQAWWCGTSGLGVCGDFLGGTGVEGAWQSAQALLANLRPAGLGTGAESPLPSSD